MGALTAIQAELGEVVVHVGNGSGQRLLGFACGRLLFHLNGFFERVVLLGHVLGPLE